MIIHLLDIAPWPSEELRLKSIKAMEEREAKQAQKKVEKQMKKAEKKLEKAAKKAEKKMKKAEKKLDKQFKNLSEAPTKTITTVQECTENSGEMQYASIPIGLVLGVCASLLLCLGSAWYYCRRSTKV